MFEGWVMEDSRLGRDDGAMRMGMGMGMGMSMDGLKAAEEARRISAGREDAGGMEKDRWALTYCSRGCPPAETMTPRVPVSLRVCMSACAVTPFSIDGTAFVAQTLQR